MTLMSHDFHDHHIHTIHLPYCIYKQVRRINDMPNISFATCVVVDKLGIRRLMWFSPNANKECPPTVRSGYTGLRPNKHVFFLLFFASLVASRCSRARTSNRPWLDVEDIAFCSLCDDALSGPTVHGSCRPRSRQARCLRVT